ncbi:MAG: hypothetical protein GXP63_03555 [DPANN group archaeon]|nr:hypothetical protein [DPANN group archaeon]
MEDNKVLESILNDPASGKLDLRSFNGVTFFHYLIESSEDAPQEAYASCTVSDIQTAYSFMMKGVAVSRGLIEKFAGMESFPLKQQLEDTTFDDVFKDAGDGYFCYAPIGFESLRYPLGPGFDSPFHYLFSSGD